MLLINKSTNCADVNDDKPGSFLYRLKIIPLIILFLITASASCKKMVEVQAPETSLTGNNVYTTDATATSVLTGLYTFMSDATYPFATGQNSISIDAGLSSDELTLYPGSDVNSVALYQNSLSSQTAPVFWTNFYYFLHTINAALEGISSSTSLTTSVRQELLGEAKFMRAFCNFYLVNLYGDIPLLISSDYKINSSVARASTDIVYKQIIADLIDAQSLLPDNYLSADAKTPTEERVRPNKWTATALLARVYLYSKDWATAESLASAVIGNTNTYSLASDLNGVFLKNSSEAIWQLQPVKAGENTQDAAIFIIPDAGPDIYIHNVYLSSSIMNSFDGGDGRKTNWTDSVNINGIIYHFPAKYKLSTTNATSPSEYLMVMRLAEQFLIRAEARAEQGNISAAVSDLNTIRNRAGLSNYTGSVDMNSILRAIIHERQNELFTEWGNRWFDLKRSSKIDSVMATASPQKGGTWNTNWQLYPIPFYDIQSDANLIQNTGY